MAKNLGWVRNPLTIIGIFSTLTEALCLVILPHITELNQSKFIWFTMLFPAALLFLFFYTLIFHHTKLYAPTDFSEDKIEFAAMFLNRSYSGVKEVSPAINSVDNENRDIVITSVHPMLTASSSNETIVQYHAFPSDDVITEDARKQVLKAKEFFATATSLIDKTRLSTILFTCQNPAFYTITLTIKPEFVSTLENATFIVWVLNFGKELEVALIAAGTKENDVAGQVLFINNYVNRFSRGGDSI